MASLWIIRSKGTVYRLLWGYPQTRSQHCLWFLWLHWTRWETISQRAYYKRDFRSSQSGSYLHPIWFQFSLQCSQGEANYGRWYGHLWRFAYFSLFLVSSQFGWRQKNPSRFFGELSVDQKYSRGTSRSTVCATWKESNAILQLKRRFLRPHNLVNKFSP